MDKLITHKNYYFLNELIEILCLFDVAYQILNHLKFLNDFVVFFFSMIHVSYKKLSAKKKRAWCLRIVEEVCWYPCTSFLPVTTRGF